MRAQGRAIPNIGYWDNAQDIASWNVHFDAPGVYAVSARASADYTDIAFALDAGPGVSVTLGLPKTAGWDDYHILTMRPTDPVKWRTMNLASVTLTRST